ncbi:hypothetical protein APICC_05367 [Apis cerana cerana]|uniref:Uncharacterized protein n=1 Tax=Apis cerana cerana TaxID=94128 RepID=A0A2A3E280_APICC|nr:hypothetical protein APICC_05367 [Apis cerana cerana]
MRGNQFNPTKEFSQILFQSSPLRKQEQESKKEQRTLLLLPMSINIRKISKKLLQTRTLDQGMQKPKTSNTK